MQEPRATAATSAVAPRRKIHPIVAAVALAAVCALAVGAQAPAPLTQARQVLSLTAEQASARLPVRVTGVVTAAEPDWRGQFFVQDATGGVFVENFAQPAPDPGDVVDVEGESHPGAFAPIISAPRWSVSGRAALPEAERVSLENLVAGIEDGRRVEVSGIVRVARIEAGRLRLDLAAGGYRLEVYGPPPAPGPETLVGSRVRVRGTVASHYNAVLRHLTSVAVYVPRGDDIAVLAPEAVGPFLQPVVPLNNVAQYRPGAQADQRLHVRGTVTLCQLGESVFLQDATGGIRIDGSAPADLAVGDEAEAAGFLEYENHLPLLRDAVVRRLDGPRRRAESHVVPYEEIRSGRHHAELVTVRGRVLDLWMRPGVGVPRSVVTTWLLQAEDLAFTVECGHGGERMAPAEIPVGSVVEADGVCVSSVDTSGRLQSFRVLLPDPGSIRVVERPGWWTPARLLAVLGLVGAGSLVLVAWLLTVSRKNAALRALVREREKARDELQEAHDTLEQKVIERSAQLQVEMSARKAEELQFKAVLAERTRLARDLHDTLEQTLAGIALHLDTAAKLFERTPGKSSHHLQLARTWLQQSQVELRNSIWDLRSRELEQFDLAHALRRSAEQLVEGTGIALDFAVSGATHGLPEIVEENVLRIGQEALTNVAKHARATRITIELACDVRVLRLVVRDDGIGVDPARAEHPGENHFGLLGMTERARRVGGQVRIERCAGGGTCVTLEIPLEPPAGDETPVHRAAAPAP